jgi:hypothetical protein
MTIQTILRHPGFLCAGTFAILWAALELGRILARHDLDSARQFSVGAAGRLNHRRLSLVT